MTETTNYNLKKPDSTDTVDISVLNGNADTLDSELDKLSGALALIQRGDEATQNIEKGQYVLWKGNLTRASVAITEGETLSASNLESVTGGILNDYSTFSITPASGVSIGSTGLKNGGICSLVVVVSTDVAKGSWKTVGTIPEGYRPRMADENANRIIGAAISHTALSIGTLQIAFDGEVRVYFAGSGSAGGFSSQVAYVCE